MHRQDMPEFWNETVSIAGEILPRWKVHSLLSAEGVTNSELQAYFDSPALFYDEGEARDASGKWTVGGAIKSLASAIKDRVGELSWKGNHDEITEAKGLKESIARRAQAEIGHMRQHMERNPHTTSPAMKRLVDAMPEAMNDIAASKDARGIISLDSKHPDVRTMLLEHVKAKHPELLVPAGVKTDSYGRLQMPKSFATSKHEIQNYDSLTDPHIGKNHQDAITAALNASRGKEPGKVNTAVASRVHAQVQSLTDAEAGQVYARLTGRRGTPPAKSSDFANMVYRSLTGHNKMGYKGPFTGGKFLNRRSKVAAGFSQTERGVSMPYVDGKNEPAYWAERVVFNGTPMTRSDVQAQLQNAGVSEDYIAKCQDSLVQFAEEEKKPEEKPAEFSGDTPTASDHQRRIDLLWSTALGRQVLLDGNK